MRGRGRGRFGGNVRGGFVLGGNGQQPKGREPVTLTQKKKNKKTPVRQTHGISSKGPKLRGYIIKINTNRRQLEGLGKGGWKEQLVLRSTPQRRKNRKFKLTG